MFNTSMRTLPSVKLGKCFAAQVMVVQILLQNVSLPADGRLVSKTKRFTPADVILQRDGNASVRLILNNTWLLLAAQCQTAPPKNSCTVHTSFVQCLADDATVAWR